MTAHYDQYHNPEDYINATAIFSGIKRYINAKSFKGGSIVNIFGSTELDFTGTDIDGTVVLDVSQALGETKLIVPLNWTVVNELSELAAKTDFKRRYAARELDPNKVLMLKGFSALAGVVVISA